MNIPFISKKREIALDLKDREGKRVVWYKDSYDSHIKLKHFDVKTCQDKLKKALRSPQLKLIDKKRKATHYFYEVRKDRNGNPLYIKAAVDYNSNPAFIRSAHLTTNVKGANVVFT